MPSENQISKDQAESLRKRMENNHLVKVDKDQDFLSLPPRSQVHNDQDKKVKIKIKYPLIRLLAVIFILIVILIPSIDLLKNRVEKVETPLTETGTIIVEDATKKESNLSGSNKKVDMEADTTQPNSNQTDTPPPTNENSEDEQLVGEENENTNKELTEEDSYIYHKVKGDETLYRVSQKYFKSRAGEEIIKELNGLDKNGTIYPGQTLKIPK